MLGSVRQCGDSCPQGSGGPSSCARSWRRAWHSPIPPGSSRRRPRSTRRRVRPHPRRSCVRPGTSTASTCGSARSAPRACSTRTGIRLRRRCDGGPGTRARGRSPRSGQSIGASRWTVRDGGQVWLDALIGTEVIGHMIGALRRTDPRARGARPSAGRRIDRDLGICRGRPVSSRVGAVDTLGTFAEFGVHIALRLAAGLCRTRLTGAGRGVPTLAFPGRSAAW